MRFLPAVFTVALFACSTNPQEAEDSGPGEPVLARTVHVPSQYWIVGHSAQGRIAIDPDGVTLRVRRDGGPRELQGTRTIDLRRIAGERFRALSFGQLEESPLVVAGVDGGTTDTLVLRVPLVGDLQSSGSVVYRGRELGEPIAVCQMSTTRAVVLDARSKAIWLLSLETGKLVRLADERRAPGLAHARFLRVMQSGPHGFELRASSVDEEGLNIPVITKPVLVYLRDTNGDGRVDEVRDALAR